MVRFSTNPWVYTAPLVAMTAWTCSVVNAPEEPLPSGGSGGSGLSDGGGSDGGSSPCGDGVIDPTIGETCDPPSSCPTCVDDDPCTTDDMVGTPSDCNVQCSNPPISACTGADSDECCPTGCDGLSDIDCAQCGNDIIELGETCDNDCPDSCDDLDDCTVDSQSGTASDCDVECSNDAITTCTDGDLCCPDGCDPTSDGDCVIHATCVDLLSDMTVWGQAATGFDLRPWTGSTVHWIGCDGQGCAPGDWYCDYDAANQVLAFGSGATSTVRAMVDPNDAAGDTIPTTYTGCCSAAVPTDVCNAPDNVDGSVDTADALCEALGYQIGQQISAVAANSCPEIHADSADGLSWTSDWVSSIGYGQQWQCSGFK